MNAEDRPGAESGAALMSDGEKLKSTVTAAAPDGGQAPKPIYGIPVDPLAFFAAVLADCLREQTPHYYLRRAEMFDTINPQIALACRRHAWLLSRHPDDDAIREDVQNVLSELVAS